ncbi:MAG: hypothetical protein ACRDLN_00965 [Solirubrobacteraceae bacterium]
MPKPPERFKRPEDLTADEVLAELQAKRRGAPQPRFERAEYRQYRADLLRAGGLIDEADAAEPDVEPDLVAMTPAQH